MPFSYEFDQKYSVLGPDQFFEFSFWSVYYLPYFRNMIFSWFQSSNCCSVWAVLVPRPWTNPSLYYTRHNLKKACRLVVLWFPLYFNGLPSLIAFLRFFNLFASMYVLRSIVFMRLRDKKSNTFRFTIALVFYIFEFTFAIYVFQ